MEVDAAVVQDFKSVGGKAGMVDCPFHYVDIVGAFWGHDVGLVEVDFHICSFKSSAQRGHPRSFKVRKGSGYIVEE